MEDRLDEFVGKKVWACPNMGGRLNLHLDSFSFCHETFAGNSVSGKLSEQLLDDYNELLYCLLKENMNEDSPCRKCPKCTEQVYEKKMITYVTVNPFDYCNSSCIYCSGHFGEKLEFYNPIPYFEQLQNAGVLAHDCFFDWGGGEPTLCPFFENTVKWFHDHNFSQRINTNGIIYSEATERALYDGMASLRISVDSGTRKCFELVKGHEYYDEVWENIEKYSNVTNEVYIKYNVFNYNSDTEEVMFFVQKCKSAGVKNVIIDAEICSYQPDINAGPFYFTEKEFVAAHLLEKTAKEQGLNVQISSYAFSVRAEYDADGKLCLPTHYYDNIDKEILSANIGVKTYPSLKYMIKSLKKTNKEKAIWGLGNCGKTCYEVLTKSGIEVAYLVDQSDELQQNGYLGKKVLSPEMFLNSGVDVCLILVGTYWKQMLKEINRKNVKFNDVIFMSNVHYDNFKG